VRAQTSAGVVAALLVLGVVRSAAADDTSELEGLLEEPVVSAPSKSAETASLAPATSTTITAEDLRRYGIRTLHEAINYLSLGMIAQPSLGPAEVGARGVLLTQDYGSHVLVMLDGHVLNEAWGAASYVERGAGIPLEMVDHIEVILGPGSVLYGSSAMLGVIHVVTKRARDWQGLHFIVDSELPTSIRGGAGFAGETQLLGSDAAILFQGEYYAQRGPTFDFGPQPYGDDAVTGLPRVFSSQTAPGVWGGSASESYYSVVPAGYLRVRVGDTVMAVRASLYERSIPYEGGNFDDPDNREIERWLSLDLSQGITVAPQLEVRARLYGDLYDYRQYYTSDAPEDCLDGQNAGCVIDLLGVSRSAGAELSATFDWFEDRRVVTLLGVDVRLKDVSSETQVQDNATLAYQRGFGVYQELEKALAAYVQQTARPAKWLGLNGGVRLDVDDRFGSYFSPRGALVVSPWQDAAVRGIYSQAFRAPTAFELYYADPTSQVPAGDLLPETVRSVEASIEQRVGTQRVLVGVFHSWWSDLVLTEPLTDDQLAAAIAAGQLSSTAEFAERTRNAGEVRSIGFNAAYDGSLVGGRLRYGATLTGARARRELPATEPLPLGAAPQVFGNARVSYDFGAPWPTVGLVGRVIGKHIADRVESSAVRQPYAERFAEARLTISGPFPVLRGLSYRVGANWALADRGAYVIGPAQLADGTAERNPIDTFRVSTGLQYDFVP
jgi:outer membrane receptor for ferrienterochelin and colicins